MPFLVDAGDCVVVEVSPDIHICGFCKQQYNNFEVFFAHKQNGCSFPTSDAPTTAATATLTGKKNKYFCFLMSKVSIKTFSTVWCHASVVCLSHSDSSSDFVFEETYQNCVTRGVKKTLTKAQKTPSKKIKPAMTSKRHSCCFSGCYLLLFMTAKHCSLSSSTQGKLCFLPVESHSIGFLLIYSGMQKS